MSADTLRRAAWEIRRDHEGVNYNVQSDFMLAVADWLEFEALRIGDAEHRLALAVARAYLGGDSDAAS